MSATRLITLGDAPVLAGLVRANREFLAPFEPLHDEDYFTLAGQQTAIADALTRCRQGTMLPHVILARGGRVAGRITLNSIIRGAFQSCSIGYWVNEPDTGRGLATTALREIIGVAFGELRLHRIQAETLEHNVASQRVLRRAGFTRYGLAPQYLKIAGRWQDCVLYQLVKPGTG